MSETPLSILKQYWGYDAFRPLQEDIIQAVLDGKDTLAMLPTGGGKSLCYQVPAMLQKGICIVVTPLIALMKDQVENLKQRNIRSLAVFSGMSSREIDIALDNAVFGEFKFLYLSPERLETPIFLERAARMPVSLIAVDEAHCISEWGYDFRPSYLRIAQVRELFPKVPILALTASATPDVQKDIQEKLLFGKSSCFYKQSFDRPNLVYAALHDEDKRGRILKLLQNILGSGLIYVRTRRNTKDIASFLSDHRISADFYHGGLDAGQRSAKQESWKKGQTRLMVCTNAFGMGIDKPDVRFVIHYELPESLEAYYQEAGRGGRDDKRAFAIALANEHDKKELLKWADTGYPSVAEIKKVYHAAGNYLQVPEGAGEGQSFAFNLAEFSRNFDLNPLKTYNALQILERAGYLAFSESFYMPSRLRILVSHEDLYAFEVANRKYEPVIKLILRSYGGCFEEYVTIDELQIGKKLVIATREVMTQLHDLNKLSMLDYRPQTSEPQLTFLTERLPNDNLLLEHKLVAGRKKLHMDKLQAMLDYTFADDRCRGKLLLRYFGEAQDADCGHCDWCLKNKKADSQGNVEAAIEAGILKRLAEGEAALEELLSNAVTKDREQVLKVIRRMIDAELIRWKDDKLLIKA